MADEKRVSPPSMSGAIAVQKLAAIDMMLHGTGSGDPCRRIQYWMLCYQCCKEQEEGPVLDAPIGVATPTACNI